MTSDTKKTQASSKSETESSSAKLSSSKTKRGDSGKKRRKPYNSPKLEELGDIREITLGGSPGVGDSGNFSTEKPP